MNSLIEAIQERRARALDVREDYTIVYAGLQAWVVQSPAGRVYFVDMIERRCTCPDWHCTVQGTGVDCKHIYAVEMYRSERSTI
jgi:predicted nucleic acid-binding Zn finger protein